jgi:mRNA interferase HigB
MKVVGFDIAVKFGRKHRDAQAWLNQFRQLAAEKIWTSLADVRKDFAHADGVPLKSGLVVTVFNVKGNEYRLLTRLAYHARTVQILEVMTHEAYSRNAWKNRY